MGSFLNLSKPALELVSSGFFTLISLFLFSLFHPFVLHTTSILSINFKLAIFDLIEQDSTLPGRFCTSGVLIYLLRTAVTASIFSTSSLSDRHAAVCLVNFFFGVNVQPEVVWTLRSLVLLVFSKGGHFVGGTCETRCVAVVRSLQKILR